MIRLKQTTSTSDYLKENVEKYFNFDAVFTTNQTQGRGRNGHTWESEPNKNSMFSFLIKDEKIIVRYNYVSIVIGIVVANYLENIGVQNVELKWPNDVLVNGKKICGILLEGNLPNYIIVGIGVNVNQTEFQGFEATSIKNEIGIKIEPSLVAADLFDLLKETLEDLPNDMTDFIDEYDNRDFLKNKEVTFNLNGEQKTGVAKGIDYDGTLSIEHNGKIININSDEVNLIREK